MSLVDALVKLDSEIEVAIHSDKDITALKILVDNSIRVGVSDMSNITIATVHPSLWFEELYHHFKECLSIVPKRPQFFLLTIENGELVRRSVVSQTKNFDSDEEITKFFQEECKFRSLSIFSINKYLDVSSLKTQWSLRYTDISDPIVIRDKKLDNLVNI